MARQIALLRGINLGPRNRVSMPELRELLTGLGYGDVRTLLQSGNVVVDSDAPPDHLAGELEKAISSGLGVQSAVVVRTRDELADVIARDPFGNLVTDPKRHQVTFLAEEPGPGLAERAEEVALPSERVVVDGREIYAWHPDGLARSKLAALLADKRLGVTATARNWNTVTKLFELAGE